MFVTLDQMVHYIRTLFGDSVTFYAHPSNERLHGIGQGNGAGPMIWVNVSTPLLNRLRECGCGVKLESANPNNSPSCQLTAFTFVDDNDMIQEIKDTERMIPTTQRSLDLWVQSLVTTGGAVSAEKSSWSPLIHCWKKDEWSIECFDSTTPPITVKDEQGIRQALTKCPPQDASLALGIIFSPSGTMKHQVLHLKNKCRDWARKIRCSNLSRHEVYTAMTLTIWKTIEYSLLATTMSEAQCNEIVSIVLMAGLPKSGICRYADRDPIFSSFKYQGFGLKHPYLLQGLKKLHLLLSPIDDTNQFLLN
jgi:hypothetical protein